MHRRLSLFFMVVGGIGAPCFAWAMHRASISVVVSDPSWPRPWPYPDGWLADLADWYDARNPAPEGMIKLHGELPQVWATMALGLVGCLWWLATGISIGVREAGPPVLHGQARASKIATWIPNPAKGWRAHVWDDMKLVQSANVDVLDGPRPEVVAIERIAGV